MIILGPARFKPVAKRISPTQKNHQPLLSLRTVWIAVQITAQEAKDLEAQTVRQADSALWHEARKFRLTASNFHKIVKRQKEVTEKFVTSLMYPTPFSAPQTDYGKAHEKLAKKEYSQKKPSVHVHDCGFVVNPQFTFLGASPDGKVCCEAGALEIKCPYSARDKTIKEAVEKVNNFCLMERQDEICLEPDHDYMYQVQGQLMITGAPFCEFAVYTKKDMHIQQSLPHEKFEHHMRNKLSAFYKIHILPNVTAH